MVMSNNGFSKLAEETGELQQVIGKTLAYGLSCDNHPDGGKPLVDRFIEESGDVIAAICFIMQKYNLDQDALNEREPDLNYPLLKNGTRTNNHAK